MTDKKKTDNKNVMVYQANPLIEARRDFDLIEMRLFYIGLKDLKPQLTKKNIPWENMTYRDFPVTVIPPKDLIEMFGSHKYYSTLYDVCEKMAKKTVKSRNEFGRFDWFTVFSRLSYTPEEGLILKFNPDMIPWLLELADRTFTKIPYEIVWQLKSHYSVRLLELLLQYQNTKTHERTMTIEDLRFCLNVPDGVYSDRVDNFKRYVIDSSIKEINKKTAYKIEYENVKDGRKIVGFKFKLYLPAELKREKQKKKVQEVKDIIAGLADGKSMTGNNTPSDSRKRPMPDFMVTDKDGNKIKDPYDKPVKITKDGKVVF